MRCIKNYDRLDVSIKSNGTSSVEIAKKEEFFCTEGAHFPIYTFICSQAPRNISLLSGEMDPGNHLEYYNGPLSLPVLSQRKV